MRRREIYIAITMITGLLMIVDFFVDAGALNTVAAELRNWVVILTYFAVVLGLVNISIFHTKRITKRSSKWIYSAWLIFIIVSVTLLGVFGGTEHPMYKFLFQNIYGVLGPCGYGIMAFFIASAAYRVLRVKNIEALVLLLAVVLTLLYRAPIGGIIPLVPEIGDWIQSVPSTGGMRGIIIGMAIGAIGMGLRVLLGHERGYLPE